MSKNLDNIREKIDSLDNQIHDVLMERAALISDVLKEKQKHGLQIVHPAREALMIRRLLKRHKGILPEATIVRIWRELVGSVSLLQSGLKVIVSDPNDNSEFWDMARNYFGSVIPMQKITSPLMAISAIRENEASFAVVPWPKDLSDDKENAAPWWNYLFHQEDKDSEERINVVCALPYGTDPKTEFSQMSLRALVISKTDFRSSNDDRSFVGIEVPPDLSRAKLIDALGGLDLEVLSVNTFSGAQSGNNSLHVIEIDAYVTPDDDCLKHLKSSLGDVDAYICVLGGYPAVPEFKTTIEDTFAPVLTAPDHLKKTA